MAMLNSVQSSCDFVLYSVRTSGLNFTCQETPYSIFLTLRKTFTKFRNPVKTKENIVFNVKQEQNDAAYDNLKHDYEAVVADSEACYRQIEMLTEKNKILHDKLSDAQNLIENFEHKIKLGADVKKTEDLKREQTFSENKTLKNKISELNKELKTCKNELKTTTNIKKEESNDQEKKIYELEKKKTSNGF